MVSFKGSSERATQRGRVECRAKSSNEKGAVHINPPDHCCTVQYKRYRNCLIIRQRSTILFVDRTKYIYVIGIHVETSAREGRKIIHV